MANLLKKITDLTAKPDLIGKTFGRWTVISFAGRLNYPTNNGKTNKQKIWLCECKCGTIRTVRDQALRNNDKNPNYSCGCFMVEEVINRFTLPNNMGAINKIYSVYQKDANRRGRSYEFKLSKDIFIKLITSDCFYCGIKPFQNYSTHPNFKYNGIDRINNNLGYIEDNVVSCCGKCNRAKDTMSQIEFLKLIENIYNKQNNYGKFT